MILPECMPREADGLAKAPGIIAQRGTPAAHQEYRRRPAADRAPGSLQCRNTRSPCPGLLRRPPVPGSPVAGDAARAQYGRRKAERALRRRGPADQLDAQVADQRLHARLVAARQVAQPARPHARAASAGERWRPAHGSECVAAAARLTRLLASRRPPVPGTCQAAHALAASPGSRTSLCTVTAALLQARRGPRQSCAPAPCAHAGQHPSLRSHARGAPGQVLRAQCHEDRQAARVRAAAGAHVHAHKRLARRRACGPAGRVERREAPELHVRRRVGERLRAPAARLAARAP